MQNPSCIRFRGAFCNTRGCRRGLKVASRLFGKPLTFQPQGKKEGSQGINATSHIVHNLLDICTNFLLIQKKHVLSPFLVVTFCLSIKTTLCILYPTLYPFEQHLCVLFCSKESFHHYLQCLDQCCFCGLFCLKEDGFWLGSFLVCKDIQRC